MADVEASVASASGKNVSGCASRVVRVNLALHSSNALISSAVQVMGWEPLTPVAERTSCSCAWVAPRGAQIPIEVQHAQKSTELTGVLWWVIVLKMGHSFFLSLGTLGGHLGSRPVVGRSRQYLHGEAWEAKELALL
jgi:hypothetical protein